jgi:Ca2+-binding EF-hand superfamily protein
MSDPDSTAKQTTHTLSIEHEGDVYDLYYKVSMTGEQVSMEIQRVLGFARPVVALIHIHYGVVFPLSLLPTFPSLFGADTRFAPLVAFTDVQAQQQAAEEEEREEEGEEGEDMLVRDLRERQQQQLAESLTGAPELTGEALWGDEPDLPTEEGDAMEVPPDVLQYIQERTEFSRLSMSRLMAVFHEAATSSGGRLGRESFERAYLRLVGDVPFVQESDGGSQRNAVDCDGQALTGDAVASRLFSAFDKDGNGFVDFQEFVAGLSLLCRDSSSNKIDAAFSLFDTDGDGYISHEEMLRYMTSFFEVCFALDPSLRRSFGGGVTAADVGRATAEHCFVRADSDKNGVVSY